MPSPKRTVSDRMAIQHAGSLSPDAEVLSKVLMVLQALAERHGTTTESEPYLLGAARYLAGAITVYANSKRADVSDTKLDLEEPIIFREDQAARLLELAREMEAIMGHPACQYLAMLPPDEQKLRALLQKLIKDHESRTPAAESRAIRAAARASLGQTVKSGKGVPLSNRLRICHALEHAWFISTGQEKPPGRKHTNVQETYGEFFDFIRDVLSLTKETQLMRTDEVHLDILGMGE
jgi:hypothetical protein